MAISKRKEAERPQGQLSRITPPIVSQQEWEAARQQLLVKEKALTRSRDALAAERHAELLARLATLPARQREALVLRFYADLSEAQTAEAMGISPGAVKSHTARGLAALRREVQR